jgi:hypothetical protein
MKKFLAMTLAFALFGATAQAKNREFDGNTLLNDCNKVNQIEEGICIGYIAAILDEAPVICVPPRVTYRQLKDIVVQHLKSNPDQRHFTAAQNIIVAFLNVGWKCQ